VRHSRYLAIETSSPRLSLALSDDERLLEVYQGPHDWRHAESLFQGIQKILRRQKWPLHSLTGVAVSIGPGSFTGIRIGLACARALGQALKIPVVGASALEIMAWAAPQRAQWISPQVDAQRGEIFTALFQRTASRTIRTVVRETLAHASDWKKRVRTLTAKEPVWFSPLGKSFPDAGDLLKLAMPRLKKAGTTSYKNVFPLYIRRASAEERRNGN
jgi:tRNA threonylcarbamoyladenosine biosynthesis protein TsaB